MRHGWTFGGGLVKYPNEYVRFGSSVANSNLITKLRKDLYPDLGGTAYAENGDIQNRELERPRFVPEIIEFEYPVNYDLLQKVRGKSIVNGEEIMNYYGLIEFKNENNEIEKGFLLNLKPRYSYAFLILSLLKCL